MKRIILLIIAGMLSLSLNVYAEEPSSWAEEAIEELKNFEVVDESIFSSYQDYITRLEFASLMVHFYELYKGEIKVDASIVFLDTNDIMAVKAATVGISSGVGDGKFDPSASITREQMAVLLVNTLELCQIELGEGGHSYVDEAAISSWAKKGVSICSGEGLLSGMGENKFSPKGTATKEMAYVVFDKMINAVPMAKRLAIRKLIESEKYPLNEIIRYYNACDEVILEVNRLSETYDYDKDGISDYYEIYRNFTDPVLADTDGDGLLDGDWLERTEYTYVIKLQVRLLAPYDLDFIESHIEQDMKLLEETKDYADIELIIYPYHKLDQTLVANKNYKEDNEEIMNGIQPGLTNDWDEKYRDDLIALLKENSIDPDTMSDQDLIFSILYFFEMEDYKGDEGYISEFSDITETGYHMYDWYTSFVDGKAVINPLILDKRPKVTQEIEATLDITTKDFEAYTG
ncbi:S-layer homology domain-containing protein [Acidaminobacter sp. JC074]|uniref:S-layer homology domain-containing protein n=1 Tax=Acidaminobacter sp. JC074 TaxID=2530199 RepID=UPI001F10B521|nr:S-layer homology domain-containing protein [Acidaminobacter sp. JC074]MCH4889328.1 S-layer homology domain-containing protein [Acidaminobacter sp. JC074]